ncbi:MAG: helix-turn-helix transcriptional regulator [Bacteroidetes bacterium]|nr:helix-turn-helix transcriptional regulator [Bacteroidota bacterium]
MTKIRRIRSITEFHQLRQLPKPQHPLISVVNVEDIYHAPGEEAENLVLDYYSISLKRNFSGKFRYGQQEYDFDEGVMFFIAPGQVFRIDHDSNRPINQSGWMLLIHPDFLWNTPLAKSIRQREYFDYSVHEALFLSRKEEDVLTGIIGTIQQEYQNNIDQFSQNILISHLDTLLNYAERFYHRQFLTRKIANHQVLDRLEAILEEYFTAEDLIKKGLPSVQEIATRLNISPNYLSGLLKVLTGQTTQQHIHEKLIEKAKEKLSTTDATVSEIAYELGFEHPQSFSKFFKTKTNQSPLEFRQSFN